ncbi:hypothetical protein E3A20_30450 [Planctomyces bekefii]|uniref:Uncharacterized protein n=1 Tax=Planctomyces bekefii TaxID=1653850 RepID=A0A5C6LZM4_9PLAN|nr:hypothetical protein E3A20_30450 [Planctomyces bekefii]
MGHWMELGFSRRIVNCRLGGNRTSWKLAGTLRRWRRNLNGGLVGKAEYGESSRLDAR